MSTATNRRAYFQVTNTRTGLDLGLYKGCFAADALNACARDAGYDDYDHARQVTGSDYATLAATRVPDTLTDGGCYLIARAATDGVLDGLLESIEAASRAGDSVRLGVEIKSLTDYAWQRGHDFTRSDAIAAARFRAAQTR
jgi:hypothetical protein